MITLSTQPKLQIDNGIYAIAGISKNSGKTSFLNWLVAKSKGSSLGVLTTGRDGEDIDLVYGNPKPAVKLAANILFTSSTEAIDQLGTAIEVITKLPYSAGTKKLWLLRSLREIETEIVGPGSAKAQIETAQLMQSQGAEIVLIDGSLDRKSIALNVKIKGVFLVAGGSYGSLDKITSELTKYIQLSRIPQIANACHEPVEERVSIYKDEIWQHLEYSSLLGNEQEIMHHISITRPEKLYIPGALTDSILHGIKPALKYVSDIIIRHPLQVHLQKANLEYLLTEHNVFAIQPFNIIAVAVNCWSVKGNHLDSKTLRDSIRKLFPNVPVIDVCEA